MKKLFKLLSLLKLVKELRSHRGRFHGPHDHWRPKSRSHYPLYERRGLRRSIADRLIGRLLHGRRY